MTPRLKPSGADHTQRGGLDFSAWWQGDSELWFQGLHRSLILTNRVSAKGDQTEMVTCDRKCLSF